MLLDPLIQAGLHKQRRRSERALYLLGVVSGLNPASEGYTQDDISRLLRIPELEADIKRLEEEEGKKRLGVKADVADAMGSKMGS